MKLPAKPLSLRSALRRIAIGGSLAMVYTTGISSPATTEFFRAIGADEWHFGLISGIPLVLLAMQYVGAAFVNRVSRRAPTFFFCLIACRLVYLPIAFVPWTRLGISTAATMTVILLLLSFSAAVHNYAVPFWFSWMADLVPRPILNRYWGRRQWAMNITWSFSYLAVTAYLYYTRQPITVVYRTLVVVAVLAGLADIALFFRISEPPNLTDPDLAFWTALREPFRAPAFRSFVRYSCAWSFSAMFAASFMMLYVLKVLGLAPWKTALIWCLQGIGVGAVAAGWGRIADRHGHRPILNICVTLKSLIVLVFILLTPSNVVWLLPLALLPDGMLNSGTMVASNGYMLSYAPQRNRSMFIASITGLAGLAGGLGAVAGGALLKSLGPGVWRWMGRDWNAYHAVFAVSMILRWLCIPLARRIREPDATRSLHVLNDVLGELPHRFLRFPVGLYRRFVPGMEDRPQN